MNNLKIALNLLRKEGLLALVRAIYVKLSGIFRRSLSGWLRKLYSETQGSTGMERHKLVLFTGVPYDDIGGGQRSAQLTHCALRTGIQVLYVYIYPKYDVQKRRSMASNIKIPNLRHMSIQELSLIELLNFIDADTTVLFEIPHPRFAEYLEITRMRGIRTVFELIDDWSTNLGGDWFDEAVFHKFIFGADVAVGTSRQLVGRLIEAGRRDAIYLPNAANEYIFNHQNEYDRPDDLPAGRIALYFGSLYGEWFGWKYISQAARQNPRIHFCLIGNPPARLPIDSSENVHLLGEKKIEVLPAYLSAAEFCLLPFTPGQLSDSVSPIKVFEYLFMLKPVVSTRLQEVAGYPAVFHAENEADFARLSQDVMDQTIDKDQIKEFISRNSWFSRLHSVMGIGGAHNVSAIILIHNNREIIGRCIKSLLENCSSYLAEVIVVDNASEDGGGDFIRETFPSVQVLTNPYNGCSSGRNLGVKHSNGKYLAFFDSDQWFTSGFCCAEALSILEAHAQIGAVGWAAGWLDLRGGSLKGSVVDYYPRRALNAQASMRGYRTDIAYLGTGGLFIPRTLFDATGGFDTAYDPTSFEDTDLSFAIRKLGFEIAYRDLSSIRHEAHQTTTANHNSPEYLELYAHNSRYLLEKWKDYPHYFRKYVP